jgi:hypothetical protein
MLYFIFDNKTAWITSKKNETGKEVGEIKNIKIIYLTDNLILFNNKIDKPPVYLYPLLKSNLQKQIRRGEKEAVSTAELMLDLNAFELLRRLSVIALEDVEMSFETCAIVWLMAATSKGFVLTPFLKKFILNYVYNLTKHPVCRRLLLEKVEKEYKKKLSLEEVLSSKHSEKEFIAAILFRASFGGLKGDILMISELCDEIIQNDRKLEFLKTYSYEIPKLKILDSAIDFHIFPKLIELIQKDTGIKPEIIQKTIWECSSRINYRFQETSENMEIWKEIKIFFDYHTKIYLSKVIKLYF